MRSVYGNPGALLNLPGYMMCTRHVCAPREIRRAGVLARVPTRGHMPMHAQHLPKLQPCTRHFGYAYPTEIMHLLSTPPLKQRPSG